MKISRAWRMAAMAGMLVLSGGCLSRARTAPGGDTARATVDRRDLADKVIATWSNVSALAARRTMEEYGVPDEVHYGRLVWNHSGPWKKTTVRDVRPTYVEGDELGIVQQVVDYPLTEAQAADMSKFDPKVAYNPKNGELTAISDREEINFLRMNLADDVAQKRMNVDQARGAYASVVSLEASGKSSPYLLGLRFPHGR